MRKFGREISAIGKDMSMKITAPVAGLGIAVLKAAGDFEAGMNRVQAITGATTEQFTDLRNIAKELGATTQFSATEAAGGIEMLAKNGLKYQDIVDGALEATLKLSAATGSDLSRAADIATDAMLAFGVEAKNMESAVNAITGVTLNSKFDIEGYAYALANAGGVAASVGVEFDDFNATIAAMAPSFSSGMTAGTSFKTFLARLVPAGDNAIGAMKALGLSFFNAKGELDDMATIAGKLQKAFGGLSEEQKLAKGIEIFGTEGVRAAFAIMNAGADDIERLKASLAETSAADQATARMKGLNGAMLKLKSALEAVAIAIADAGLLEWATEAVEAFTGWFSTLSQTNQKMLAAGTVVAGLAAALGPLALGIGALTTAISPLLALLATKGGLIASFALLANPLTALVAILGGLTAAWVLWGDEIDAFLTDYFANLIVAFDPLIQKLNESFEAFAQWVSGWADKIQGWDQALLRAFTTAGGYVLAVVDRFDGLFDAARRAFDGIGLRAQAMVNAVKNWIADKLTKILETAGAAVDFFKDKFRDLYDKVVGNSYVPDLVDELAKEADRMQRTFVQPSIKSLQAMQEEFQKTEQIASGARFTPTKHLQDFVEGGPVSRNPFNADQFKLPTGKASDQARKFEKTIGGILNTGGEQSIDQLVSQYERVGTDIGNAILNIGDGLDGAESRFEAFGHNIQGQFSGLLKNITGSAKGFDLFGGLGLDKIGNIFSQQGGGSILDMLGIGGSSGGLGGILSNIVESIGGPISGILGGIGSLFGGFFADGGSPPVGKVSVVGEKGPELFVPKTAGTILPNSAFRGISETSSKTTIIQLEQNNHFESGVSEERVGSMLKEYGRQTIKGIQDQIQRGGATRAAFQS